LSFVGDTGRVFSYYRSRAAARSVLLQKATNKLMKANYRKDQMTAKSHTQFSSAAMSSEVDFTSERLHNGDVSPVRWERARTEVDFCDLVVEITGQHAHYGGKISCPFHGTDSTPSFMLYRDTNRGWCFGCPPGKQGYDTIRFVAEHLSTSSFKAMLWLEKHYDLPPMGDVAVEDEDDSEDEEFSLQVSDLREALIRQAAREVQKHKDVELFHEYYRVLHMAERLKDPLPIARVLDPETLEAIKKRKAMRG
jgi:hypothetical protein